MERFTELCRHWRRFRKLSQLELAMNAQVSQRHVSWLETGKSQPSREMVVRLSNAMQIPLRDRNRLLRSAGFAPLYRESALDSAHMEPVLGALKRVLAHHEPLPALVVDRMWNIQMGNNAASRLLSLAGDANELNNKLGGGEQVNLALLTLHPNGFRKHIRNWAVAAPEFVQRLRHEAASAFDPTIREGIEQIIALAGPTKSRSLRQSELLPVLPLELQFGNVELSLFSVISTFGTPQDITTDELRIETFYPADETTSAFFSRS